MTAIVRRTMWLALLAAAAPLCAGCDVATLAYFLMPEAKNPPEMKQIASEDKKEVRVLILTYSPMLETRPEFIQADRQLSQELARQLCEMCKDNGEYVAIVNPRQVEEFKSSHPNWKDTADIADVGRQFKADRVIYIEINSLSLYEAGSANQLYRGQANLAVSLFDVHKPDESVGPRQFSCTYPDSRGPVPADDMQPLQFRQAFLGSVAKRLTRYFTSSPISARYDVE
jgi:hypothetical protein